MRGVIKDADLYRLFENSYPNTLDTMIKWRGLANRTDPETGQRVVGAADEELTYVITGDIDAMWLRAYSASQIYSYLPLLVPSTSPDSLASLWRGLINAHARYITISPYCHSLPAAGRVGHRADGQLGLRAQQPAASLRPARGVRLQVGAGLAGLVPAGVGGPTSRRRANAAFFGRHGCVEAAVDAAGAMRAGTYDGDGKVQPSAWTFTGWTNRGSETLTNDGLGNPSRANGMVRTAFRPSDDATIYQFLVPANMMFAKYLEEASLIMAKLDGPKAQNLTHAMRDFALGIRRGIDRDAVVRHRDFGDVFAYEVDGFGSTNMMDDSNVPSLLAMPLFRYHESAFETPQRDLAPVYRNTRRFVLSDANPYYAKGPALSAVGGPHLGPGKPWPMAAIVAAMTAYDPISGVDDVDATVEAQLRMVLDSTAGTGVIHESVDAWNGLDWTRSWFGWANGLFGELILAMDERERLAGKSGLLAKSWQD